MWDFLTIFVVAHPYSHKESIEEQLDVFWKKIYHIRIKEAPENWEANKKIIWLLSDYLWVLKKDIKLISWWGSRNKIFKIKQQKNQ